MYMGESRAHTTVCVTWYLGGGVSAYPPSQRLRYFLLAKREPHAFALTPSPALGAEPPLRFVPYSAHFPLNGLGLSDKDVVDPLSDFLEPDDSPSALAHRVPDALVVKKGVLFGTSVPPSIVFRIVHA
jgi:hypothetical protein